VSSLSAILLNDSYYELLLAGRDVIDGISILKPSWLIPFKAKAWLDLNKKREHGEHVDSRDIRKHKNDVIRISTELVLEPCNLPDEVKEDMRLFMDEFHVMDEELINLKIKGVHEADIVNILKEIYSL
jgi:hypothetical protein